VMPTFEQSYMIDLTDKFSSIDIHHENIVVSPLFMTPYKGDLWKKEDGRIIYSRVKTPSMPLSWTKLITDSHDTKSSRHIPAIETKVKDGYIMITGVNADTMTLSNNIYLQLFGNIDPSKRFVGFRIRYLRTTDDGTPLEDVMLREYHPIK
jgi:hypothetical protein